MFKEDAQNEGFDSVLLPVSKSILKHDNLHFAIKYIDKNLSGKSDKIEVKIR